MMVTDTPLHGALNYLVQWLHAMAQMKDLRVQGDPKETALGHSKFASLRPL
jgi:hypothetical protein